MELSDTTLNPTPQDDTPSGSPEQEQEREREKEDVVVVLTADDAAARERLLAARAMRRLEGAARRHAEAEGKRAFGITLMKIKNYEGAVSSFGDACNLWRTNPVMHCDLATAYLHLGRYEDAEASSSNALNLDPKLVEARYVRGMARKGRGVLKAAVVDFETVLQLEPTNEAAQAQLRELTAELAPVDAALENGGVENGVTTTAVDPDFDPAHPLITPTIPLLPTLDPELLSTSDTSDAGHTGSGSGTPCLFYNHSGCLRGAACTFSHAPDHKSVRDGLGKNVCLYFLLGLCKFGLGKCIYSHEKKWLPQDGWWDDEGVVERVKKRVEREREGRRERREEREREKERRRGERNANGNGKGRARTKRGRTTTTTSTNNKPTPAPADPLTAEIERRMALFAAMGVPVGGLSPADVLRQMHAIAASGVPMQIPITPSVGIPLSPGVQMQMQMQLQQLANGNGQGNGQGQQEGEALARQIRELEGRMVELQVAATAAQAQAQVGVPVPAVEVHAASPVVGRD
ncbi:hypothetical protein C8F01DRAFT_1249617 [Mycena amicta]|nr:hypothetical protein C8F01DRAFT_1249617 [Mycena amicta]